MRIFQNQPNTLDFDKADSMEAAQDVELTEKQLSGDLILLKFVKFQNVTNLQFFFKVFICSGRNLPNFPMSQVGLEKILGHWVSWITHSRSVKKL